MDKEQIKAISESIPMEQRFSVEQIVSAAIESYKAELLKEVGEPFAYAAFNKLQSCYEFSSDQEDVLAMPQTILPTFDLYTSDQVSAAILKATKPLEEEIERLQDEDNLPVRYYQPNGKGPVYAVYGSSSIDFVEKLRNQLTVAQEEIERYKASPTVETCRQMIESQAVKENKILFDQLAKEEQQAKELSDSVAQKVAEACADYFENAANLSDMSSQAFSKDFYIGAAGILRSGQWRKFVKEN